MSTKNKPLDGLFAQLQDIKDADGGSGIGQEPAADTHELQWFLESLEDRDAVEIDVH